VSNLFYPDMQHADLEMDTNWSVEATAYKTGYVHRDWLWNGPGARFQLHYGILTDAQYRNLWNFFCQHRGAFEHFWFTDYTEPNPRAKLIAIADGNLLNYKMPIDAMDAVPPPVVYRDGFIDAFATINTATGVVSYMAPPPAGAVLSFDADNARYRVRFEHDDLPSDRHKFICWGATVTLVQTKPDM